ncbi:MAG: phosphate signaling complex protein PhoU [Turicibacter sp.]|jgi:phosphate transport system protein|uniref:Phosphate-specific transport system accessory protein PhoU n=1 Tax=Turicibacter faecis TaxID=2963365 RepID=A0ABM8IL02_9FIRM|nr:MULTISPECIES: phosphate signaling complex protein PhoU [unclassified Turicibacter]MCI8702052.1 phosphate signaling complex protein PhoU [Turicibacter sp.]BEH91798.1 phosphate transport system regulatory protein PhoU [Turicibacter sp. TC023]MCU7205134.1 phosphate signaling complex protein PhoU [Turicibacter sp. TA25]MCU7209844.1 phosphate signaling complex protein PhoU [Turicibacter sp. 1E2]NCE78914.1 phosphate transport system regulatory protein PhoU [Turicibacter sp. TS3]
MKKTRLETDYEVLLQEVNQLSQLTIQAYEQTLLALKTLDLEIALTILKKDQKIDNLSEEIVEEATIVIIRQQPVASDLRKILMIMRLATEYERIADYTKNLAEYIILIKQKESLEHYEKNVDKLVYMIELVIKMLTLVIEGLKEENKTKVKEAADLDKKVDEVYNELMASLITHIQVVDGKVFGTAYAILINKYIERAGDHVTNIAEEVLYALKGHRYHLN